MMVTQVPGNIVSLSTDPSGKKLFVCSSGGAVYRLDFASGVVTHEYTSTAFPQYVFVTLWPGILRTV